MSTLKATNLQHASAASPAIVLASSGSATAQLSSINDGPIAGARNRIINGDMRIDQRNAGASVTPIDNQYTIDRWTVGLTQPSKFSIQQSTTAPAGFTNSLLATSLSAYTVGASDEFEIMHRIEGNNVSDLAWGTASASTVTLSFWVRSSLTGTFGGSINNGISITRSYAFSYSISAANTWEYKRITLSGDASGTWNTNTSVGVMVLFSLGAGSSVVGTAGSWGGTFQRGVTGQVNLVATNGATFYITGVQLEPGSVATPFERRSYGQELALCQRYFSSGGAYFDGYGTTANQSIGGSNTQFPVEMRAAPTMTHGAITSVLNAKVGGTRATTAYANYRYALAVAGGSVVATESWTASAEL